MTGRILFLIIFQQSHNGLAIKTDEHTSLIRSNRIASQNSLMDSLTENQERTAAATTVIMVLTERVSVCQMLSLTTPAEYRQAFDFGKTYVSTHMVENNRSYH